MAAILIMVPAALADACFVLPAGAEPVRTPPFSDRFIVDQSVEPGPRAALGARDATSAVGPPLPPDSPPDAAQ